MKIRTLLMTLMATTLVFSGCLGNTSQEATEEADDGLDTRIYGTWDRTATFTDGENMGTDPATTIFMEDGLYTSIGTMCTVNGAYIVIDDLLRMTIDSNNCPGYTGPYEFDATFTISEDGEGLTTNNEYAGHLVTETFVRATE